MLTLAGLAFVSIFFFDVPFPVVALSAAVVGVALNLAVWFALNTVFGKVEDYYGLGMHALVPVWGSLNVPAVVMALFALVAIFRFKLGVIKTIGCCAGLGVGYHALLWAIP